MKEKVNSQRLLRWHRYSSCKVTELILRRPWTQELTTPLRGASSNRTNHSGEVVNELPFG
jgi:hypothetical protein